MVTAVVTVYSAIPAAHYYFLCNPASLVRDGSGSPSCLTMNSHEASNTPDGDEPFSSFLLPQQIADHGGTSVVAVG